VVEEIRELEKAGTKEVIISGVHLGGYGSDLDKESDLKLLLESILKYTSIPRVRLGSLEPWDIPDDFFELWQNPRMMPHLHLPLQSGSTPVLKRMARRCMTKTFEKLIVDARAQVPNINITTDIIVGFPGESEEEFQESYDFIKKLAFGDMHIFSFSPRPGTKAAFMPGQIDTRLKKQRSKILHELCEALKNNYENNILSSQHKNTQILFETQKLNSNIWTGHNKFNLKIEKEFKPGFNAKNKII
jgi:threonylcarbamoyladenosine tRNA methylthiotransferase MtaB